VPVLSKTTVLALAIFSTYSPPLKITPRLAATVMAVNIVAAGRQCPISYGGGIAHALSLPCQLLLACVMAKELRKRARCSDVTRPAVALAEYLRLKPRLARAIPEQEAQVRGSLVWLS